MPCPPSYEELKAHEMSRDFQVYSEKLNAQREILSQTIKFVNSCFSTAAEIFDFKNLENLNAHLSYHFDPIPEMGCDPYNELHVKISQNALDWLSEKIKKEEDILCSLSCYLVNIWDNLNHANLTFEQHESYRLILEHHKNHRKEDKNMVLRNLIYIMENHTEKPGYNKEQLNSEVNRIHAITEYELLRKKEILNGLGTSIS